MRALQALLYEQIHEASETMDVNPRAIRDLAQKAAMSGAFGVTSAGTLERRAGETPRTWLESVVALQPFYRRPSSEADTPAPKVNRHAPNGRRRTASELLDLANEGGV
jgi:hypothetical protein